VCVYVYVCVGVCVYGLCVARVGSQDCQQTGVDRLLRLITQKTS